MKKFKFNILIGFLIFPLISFAQDKISIKNEINNVIENIDPKIKEELFKYREEINKLNETKREIYHKLSPEAKKTLKIANRKAKQIKQKNKYRKPKFPLEPENN
ncbi:MAG: hypothetical protein J0H68_06825 [Sphingobacteriia bacterium]|nr:hypothetical protein [Sphingobacteriia bacterium]